MNNFLLVSERHSYYRCLSYESKGHPLIDLQKLLLLVHSAFAAVQSRELGQRLALVVFRFELHECMPPVKASDSPLTCIVSFDLSPPVLDVPEKEHSHDEH